MKLTPSNLLAIILFAFAIALLVAGCSGLPRSGQSWDQENLKRHDSGCPTAIFIAPQGDLQQCL